MKKSLTHGMLFILILSFLGCAVSTPIERSVVPAEPEKLKTLVVHLRNFSVKPGMESGSVEMLQCKTSAKGYLQNKNYFKNVEDDKDAMFDSQTLCVDAELTDIRIVSAGLRFGLGAFVGRSHMKLMVKLSDQDGNLIEEKELFGAPNAVGSSFSFGTSDKNLPQNMGRLLGDYIISKANETIAKQ